MSSSTRHSSRRNTCYRYPSDLTGNQWDLIAPFILGSQGSKRRGTPLRVDQREVVNAIMYLLRTGCSWRQLPTDFPAWEPCTDTFGVGAMTTPSLAFMMHFEKRYGNARDETPHLPPASLTLSLCVVPTP